MIKIKVNGKEIYGRDYIDIVSNLQDGGLNHPLSNIQYMEDVKRRLKITFGRDVDFLGEKEFIHQLDQLRLIEII